VLFFSYTATSCPSLAKYEATEIEEKPDPTTIIFFMENFGLSYLGKQPTFLSLFYCLRLTRAL